MYDTAKPVIRRNFIVLNAHIRKKIIFKRLKLTHIKYKGEYNNKSKVNEIERKYIMQRIHVYINKIAKPLPILIKQKERRRKSIKMKITGSSEHMQETHF